MSVKAIQELIAVSGDVDDLKRAEVAERAQKEVTALLELVGRIYYSPSLTVSGGAVVMYLTGDTMERIQKTYEGKAK